MNGAGRGSYLAAIHRRLIQDLEHEPERTSEKLAALLQRYARLR